MIITVNPGQLRGSIVAPPSKSCTQRAFAGALLAAGNTRIVNYGTSADEKAALQIITDMGAAITTVDKNVLDIQSNFPANSSNNVFCGESGLAARLFLPIAALSAHPVTISGKGSLLRRSVADSLRLLRECGVAVSANNSTLPVSVCGPLLARNLTLNAPDSSQTLSGLLFALSFCAKEPITLAVTDLKSKPYIDLTLDILNQFGKPISHNNYSEFYINPADFIVQKQRQINVEGDWSSAAFFLAGAALGGEVTVSGLNNQSAQADRAIMQVLEDIGATVTVIDDAVTVTANFHKYFEFDATDCPDLFPVLAVLAACCRGESYISGVHRLFDKESNRVESITEMLECFGVQFSVEEDIMAIRGQRSLNGTVIDSYDDHRIVMAAAIGALRAVSRVDILNAESHQKSYPAFFTDLAGCNVQVSYF
jgi:3-phosphoshikimate 1-carboxyvinyltransferase